MKSKLENFLWILTKFAHEISAFFLIIIPVDFENQWNLF